MSMKMLMKIILSIKYTKSNPNAIAGDLFFKL